MCTPATQGSHGIRSEYATIGCLVGAHRGPCRECPKAISPQRPCSTTIRARPQYSQRQYFPTRATLDPIEGYTRQSHPKPTLIHEDNDPHRPPFKTEANLGQCQITGCHLGPNAYPQNSGQVWPMPIQSSYVSSHIFATRGGQHAMALQPLFHCSSQAF